MVVIILAIQVAPEDVMLVIIHVPEIVMTLVRDIV